MASGGWDKGELSKPPQNSRSKIPGIANTKAHSSVENKGNNINVFVRVRPFTKDEKARGEKSCVQVMKDEKTIKVIDYGYGYAMARNFQFDGCLGPEVHQEKVIQNCRMHNLLESVLEGYSSAVMACGQTGSGKTFTMCGQNEGLQSKDDRNEGLIAQSVEYLFDAIKNHTMKGNKSYCLKASYYEVYNEQVNDLLRLDCAPREVKWIVKEGFYVDNLLMVDCETVEDVLSVLNEGAKNRKVGSHELNRDSSRSHCIMTLHVDSTYYIENGTPIVRHGKILFVDLAGSERLKKSKSSGGTLKETGNINRSLFTLGKVISALAEGKRGDLVPYRESMLTKLLMESVGGNSLALMIACISPSASSVDETLSTLYYATCTKTIVNVPSVNINEHDKIIINLHKEIQNLKKENHSLRLKLGISSDEKMEKNPSAPIEEVNSPVQVSVMPLAERKIPNKTESLQKISGNVVLGWNDNIQSGWMLDKERMLTQLRSAERILRKKMARNNTLENQNNSTWQDERDPFDEAENLPKENFHHNHNNFLAITDKPEYTVGRSGDRERHASPRNMVGKQNGSIGLYKGLDMIEKNPLQTSNRRNRVSVDHLRGAKVFSRNNISSKSGIRNTSFQGSITVNQSAVARLLDINVPEDKDSHLWLTS